MRKIPFWLSTQRLGVIFIFENTESLELATIENIFENMGEYHPDYEQSAKEFINQLENNWCVAFLESLHDEIEKQIVNHWIEFAPERLEEEPYKTWKERI